MPRTLRKNFITYSYSDHQLIGCFGSFEQKIKGLDCKSHPHSMSRKTAGYELGMGHKAWGARHNSNLETGNWPAGWESEGQFQIPARCLLPPAGCLLPFALEYSKEMG
jgi:hypothetical protein